MQLLCIHADRIEWEPTQKALDQAKEVNTEKQQAEEALVVFHAAESTDEKHVEYSVTQATSEILQVYEQVQAECIVLYPYAHLSSDLASSDSAETILEELAAALEERNISVHCAPFGWYKAFEIRAKGHPLAELSKTIECAEADENSENNDMAVDHTALVRKMEKLQMDTQEAPGGNKSHIQLGKELDLYTINEVVGHGLPLFTPKGATVKREIERFITDEELRRGYEHTSTPVMATDDLYKISGHWQHYKDDMFVMDVKDKQLALRPMTCPFQFILYKRHARSYRDLPVKYAELATLFRNEKSGELRGLTRVRQLTLADAHVMCRPDQFESEFVDVMDLVRRVMETFGITEHIWYRFSKRDPNDTEKYIDDPESWDYAEQLMQQTLDTYSIDYVEAEGEAAFYGPKLDLQYQDVYGKEDTLITIQIDFASAQRFNMTYVDENGEEQHPLIIHRSSTGATERLMSFLLEKTQGKLPVWLSPVQAVVLPISEQYEGYAQKVHAQLQKTCRVTLDNSEDTLKQRIKKAQLQKTPYMVIIGEQEADNQVISVRTREGQQEHGLTLDTFTARLEQETSP